MPLPIATEWCSLQKTMTTTDGEVTVQKPMEMVGGLNHVTTAI